MSHELSPQAPKRWRWKRLAWLAMVLVLGPYLYSRVASPWNRIRIQEEGNNLSTRNDRAEPLRLRIATYNLAHGRGNGRHQMRQRSKSLRRHITPT